uniref:G-protein coupled receptors family 1 profile domain-containing protein n=1 Tax=Biomphalaria glabrata TaxID=6526 RepID=A0A2C9L0N3_BIOGL
MARFYVYTFNQQNQTNETNADLHSLHRAIYSTGLTLTPFYLFVNIFFLTGLLMQHSRDSSTHIMFFLSLCFADMIPAVICIPFTSIAHEKFPSDRGLCYLWLASTSTYALAAFYSLLLMTIDRYMSVLFPLLYRKWVNVGREHVVIVCVWIYIFILACLPLLLTPSKPVQPDSHCDYYFATPKGFLKFAVFVPLSFSVFMSMVMNLHLFCKYKKITVVDVFEINTSPWAAEHTLCYLEHYASTATTQVLILVYLLLWTPFVISSIYIYRNNLPLIKIATLMDTSKTIGFLSSFLKVPIFLYYNVYYRCVFKIMLTTNPSHWRDQFQFLPYKWKRRRAINIANKEDFDF